MKKDWFKNTNVPRSPLSEQYKRETGRSPMVVVSENDWYRFTDDYVKWLEERVAKENPGERKIVYAAADPFEEWFVKGYVGTIDQEIKSWCEKSWDAAMEHAARSSSRVEHLAKTEG